MYYLEAKNHGPSSNYPITRIVMHGTVTLCVAGGARAVAQMFHNTSRDASTQYVVDPGEVVRCVPDDTIAYGAPPNKGAIHVEQTDIQGGSPSRWQDASHQSMLRLAARLVASLCLKFDIPIRKIGPRDLLAGRKGICGHADVSYAWHQTDHIDPGTDYPWDQFIALVQEAAHPTPPPATPKGNKIMLIGTVKNDARGFVGDGVTCRWVQDVGYRAILIDAGAYVIPAEFDSYKGLYATIGRRDELSDPGPSPDPTKPDPALYHYVAPVTS